MPGCPGPGCPGPGSPSPFAVVPATPFPYVHSPTAGAAAGDYVGGSAVCQQLTEPGCVAHRVAAAVVVEVGVDVPAGRLPFADPVGPPCQLLLGIGPGVEVVPVRAVQPHVDEGGGGAQDAGKLRPAHHAVGGAVPL